MKVLYLSKQILPWALAALLVLAAIVSLSGLSQAAAQDVPAAPTVSLEMHSIPSVDPGVNLSLREKHLANVTSFSSDRVILLLEPFGVPAAECFDTQLPGSPSLMDYLAQQGYDVWALDFRGFGASGRPAAFNKPFPNLIDPPQMRASEAVKDVEAALNHIFAQRGVNQSHILGYSWGTVVGAQYAGQHPDQVGKLVIYGGMHAFKLPSMTKPLEDPNNPGHIKKVPAYQMAVPSMTIDHWNMQATNMQGNKTAPHTAAAESEIARIFLASDPTSGNRNPASIRRAMGPMVDLFEIWSGRPVFDASQIKAPTLIIRGTQDGFSNDPGFMGALTNAAEKRYVEIPQATHWALYEPTAAPRLMAEISGFLAAGAPAAQQTQPVEDQLPAQLNPVLAPVGELASKAMKQAGL